MATVPHRAGAARSPSRHRHPDLARRPARRRRCPAVPSSSRRKPLPGSRSRPATRASLPSGRIDVQLGPDQPVRGHQVGQPLVRRATRRRRRPPDRPARPGGPRSAPSPAAFSRATSSRGRPGSVGDVGDPVSRPGDNDGHQAPTTPAISSMSRASAASGPGRRRTRVERAGRTRVPSWTHSSSTTRQPIPCRCNHISSRPSCHSWLEPRVVRFLFGSWQQHVDVFRPEQVPVPWRPARAGRPAPAPGTAPPG